MISREWFQLQLQFADRVGFVCGIPFDDAVLRYTNLYRRCGLGRSLDPDLPAWREFLAGLNTAPDRAEWTSSFCNENSRSDALSTYGCFHFDFLPDTRQVRIHFANRDKPGTGPLSLHRATIRQSELRAMFADIALHHPEARTVRGVSWLHSVAAYRRQYPPAYGRSARVVPTEMVLRSMPLWGQFLDHDGEVKASLAGSFLRQVAWAKNFIDLIAAFPLEAFAVECGIEEFYRFYRITNLARNPGGNAQNPTS